MVDKQKSPRFKIKPHKLTESDKRIWRKFMTPKYVYELNGELYVKLVFIGWDKSEQVWKITRLTTTKGKMQL